jgi:hypothetical protein
MPNEALLREKARAVSRSVREISIPISFEDMSRLCPHDSGLPVPVRTALKDRKRTTEVTSGFESTLREDEGRAFLGYAERQGFKRVALELRMELKNPRLAQSRK